MTEAIIVNPFEVVKVGKSSRVVFLHDRIFMQVRLQSNRAHQSMVPSTW